MAPSEKKAERKAGEKPEAAGKTDRRRLVYLKSRLKELREEMDTVKKETGDLRTKLGMEPKGKKAAAKAE